MEHFFKDLAHEGKPQLHPVRERLQGKLIAEPVDHQPGEKIPFAMDEPVRRLARIEAFAQSMSISDPRPEKLPVDFHRIR